MTHKVGSFYDPTTVAKRLIDILHPDLLANGWVREEVDLDAGAWRWAVYRNPAANNSNGIEFYMGLGLYYGFSGVAGVGDPFQTIYTTVFEQWNSTTKQATNFPVFGAGYLGMNSSGIPIYATTPRSLPSETTPAMAITSITVTNPGSGYTSPPSVGINQVHLGNLAAATAIMELSQVALGVGGSGYPASQSALACTVTGGGGSGAVVTAATDGTGVVTGYTIVSRGTGYTSVPTVTVSGGGAGATSTVTLRIKEFLITNTGSAYTVGANVTVAGGGGTGGAGTAVVNSGFAYHGLNLGLTATHYHYTISSDALALSARRDGATDAGGVYVGTYDRMLSPAQDPMPIGVIALGSSSSTVRPFDGFGFSTREPTRGASGPSSALIYDCALLIRQGGGGGILNPVSTVSVYNAAGAVAAGSELVSRTYFCGRGQTNFVRGLLKNVVYAPLPTYAHGDLLHVQQGNTVRYARYVNSGHALMIV